MTPFEIVSIINNKKEYDENDIEEYYVPFVVNRCFSNNLDSIFFANEVNSSYHIDKSLQFDFYINILPKKKRYGEWYKPEQNANIDIISEYYGINKRQAEQYINVLTDDNINIIKQRMMRGGKA